MVVLSDRADARSLLGVDLLESRIDRMLGEC